MKSLTLTRIVALLFFTSFCLGQTGTLQGTVSDSGTTKPLIGVNIFVPQVAGSSSGIEGDYTLELPAGSHTVYYDMVGYLQVEKTISIAAGETITLDMLLQESAIQLETMIVSASKFLQKVEDVTVSVEVVKPYIIQGKHAQSLSEVIEQTPGVAIVDNEPQIRSGSGFSFGAGSRVMILIDDMPILSGDAGRPTWGFMPIENVNQIEVIKGAASVLYGSSALNGVINLRTAFPDVKPTTKIAFNGGFYSDPKDAANKYWDGTPTFTNVNFLHSRIIGSVDMIVGGNFNSDDGHVGPIEDSSDRGEESQRTRLNTKLRYRPSAIPEMNIGVNASYQKGEGYNNFLWAGVDSGLYRPLAGSNTLTKQEIFTTDLSVNHLSKRGTHQNLRGRFFKLTNDNTNDQSNSSNVFYSEYQISQQFENITGFGNLDIAAGLVGQRSSGDADLFAANEDSSGSNTATNLAAYIQLNKSLAKRVKLSGGVRFENYKINQESESRTIFRSGMNVQLAKETYARMSFGQGFRIPTISEKFIRTIVGGLPIYPNLDLQSEESWNFEVGLRQNFRISRFGGTLDLAYFHQEYKNFVEFTFGTWGTPADPLFGLGFRSLNTGEARVNGVDLSLSGGGRINDLEIRILSGYTYTRPVSLTPDFEYSNGVTYLSTSSDTTDNILKYRMQHLLRADIDLEYNGLLFGTSARFNSFMNNIDRVFLDLDDTGLLRTGLNDWRAENDGGNWVIDQRIGYKISQRHQVSIIAKNIFNKAYATRPLKIEPNRKISFQYALTL
ncbi:MAG: TonB-dependent receptor [Calditrichia bacterium]